MVENADCLFCGIVAGSVPSSKRYETDAVLAFDDLNPQAPTHVLVVPKAHYTDIADLGRDPQAAAALIAGVRGFVQQESLTDFRTVFNTGAQVGQSVFHVHAHVLAGRPMTWPPG